MKTSLICLPFLMAAAAPVQATGGMTCRTADARRVEVDLVIGHTAGSALVSARMLEAGRPVDVRAAQWWLDGLELRLLLVDAQAARSELAIKATKNGRFYDGALLRNGRSRWVRCRES